MEVYDIWIYQDRSRLGYDPLEGQDITGFKVEAIDGSIGKIDEASNEVGESYLIVDTGPWIFGKKVMLPAGVIQRVDTEAQKVYVNRTKEQIKNAPEYDESKLSDTATATNSAATTEPEAPAIATGKAFADSSASVGTAACGHIAVRDRLHAAAFRRPPSAGTRCDSQSRREAARGRARSGRRDDRDRAGAVLLCGWPRCFVWRSREHAWALARGLPARRGRRLRRLRAHDSRHGPGRRRRAR